MLSRIVRFIPTARLAAGGTVVRSMAGLFRAPLIASLSCRPALQAVVSRQFHATTPASSALRTKKSAAKRMKMTGSGKLKFRHCGKYHLNIHKSKSRLRRLSHKGAFNPTWEKKMQKLIITGK